MNLIIFILIVLLIILHKYFFKKKEGFESVIFGGNKKLMFLPEVPILYIPSQNQIKIYNQLPKKIYTFWDKGWDRAPYVCQKCMESWKYYNPEYEIIKLDKKNIYKYLDKYFLDSIWKKHTIQTQSDLIRSNLLNIYGGIWADSTLFCNLPIHQWLPNYLDIGFFTFTYNNDYNFNSKGILIPQHLRSKKYKNSSRACNISNWFIVTLKNNYIINSFTEAYNYYWDDRITTNKYFNFHYVLCKVFENDNIFYEQLKKMPIFNSNLIILGADGADWGNFNLALPPTLKIKRFINNINIPVFKLSHEYKRRKYYHKSNRGKSSKMSEKERNKLELMAKKKNSLLQYLINNNKR